MNQLTSGASAGLFASGFALVKDPAALNRVYERSPLAQRASRELSNLREAFGTINPELYRGIERWPLAECALAPPGWATEQMNAELDSRATERLAEILGDHDCEHYPCSLIPSVELARHLLGLVEKPGGYELVHLTQAPTNSDAALGFDVGYWGGGNYSILCDTVIWPQWHGPSAHQLLELVPYVRDLNAHMLFPDFNSAERFRRFYLTRPWGEWEHRPGEFTVIRVDSV